MFIFLDEQLGSFVKFSQVTEGHIAALISDALILTSFSLHRVMWGSHSSHVRCVHTLTKMFFWFVSFSIFTHFLEAETAAVLAQEALSHEG